MEFIKHYISSNHPFCVFSLPGSNEIKICYVSEQIENEEKFVFASFDSSNDILELSNINISAFDIKSIIDEQFDFKPADLNNNVISKNEFENSIRSAQNEFDQQNFKKVIASRNIHVPIDKNFNPFQLFHNIQKEQISNFCYLFYSEKTGIWIGSSPELLLEYKNSEIKTMSLAGTRNLNKASWSNKEKEEQGIVTEFISNELLNLGIKSVEISKSKNIRSAHIEHICNDIKAKVENRLPSQNIVKALHPTPAVSGYPKEKALSFIQKNENYDRSFYSGYIGIQGPYSANLFVNLRCLRVGKTHLELFAGAGITKDSDPELEYQETETKLHSLLKFL